MNQDTKIEFSFKISQLVVAIIFGAILTGIVLNWPWHWEAKIVSVWADNEDRLTWEKKIMIEKKGYDFCSEPRWEVKLNENWIPTDKERKYLFDGGNVFDSVSGVKVIDCYRKELKWK
jgi:hypothetical protein